MDSDIEAPSGTARPDSGEFTVDLEAPASTAGPDSREFGDEKDSVSGNFRRSRSGLSGVAAEASRSIAEVGYFIHRIWDYPHVVFDRLELRRDIEFGIVLMSCLIFLSVDPLFFYAYEIDANQNCLAVDYRYIVAVYLFTLIFSPVSFSRRRKPKFAVPAIKVADPDIIFYQCFLIMRDVVMYYNSVGVGDSIISLTVWNLFLFLYLVKVIRVSILFTEATKSSGIFAQAKWTKALFHLLLYVYAGHVVGALWYFFAIKRQITYWKEACYLPHNECNNLSLLCRERLDDRKSLNVSFPPMTQDGTGLDFGIFHDALQSGIVKVTTNFSNKLLYCLRWGLQTLSCFGQNLQPSILACENIFVISICISTVLLLSIVVGNIETLLQSETEPERSEKTRVGEPDEEEMRSLGPEPGQWMSFKNLSEKIQNEVRKYQPYELRESTSANIESFPEISEQTLSSNSAQNC